MSPQFDLGAIDAGEIGRLMSLLARTDVEECEIEQGGYSITVKRKGLRLAGPTNVDTEISRQETLDSEGPLVIQSPAVGVFYRSAKRTGPPEVEVGAVVSVGDLLGCIEVMAVPHSVFSTHEGVLESFLVDDGEPVEYGQPIITISRQLIADS
jgi:acetyl-CoA carboxylase biotin carboxyl carrier protein